MISDVVLFFSVQKAGKYFLLCRANTMSFASKTLRSKWPGFIESAPLDSVNARSVAGWLKQVRKLTCLYFFFGVFLVVVSGDE